MRNREQSRRNAASPSSVVGQPTLQRKCACGQHTVAGGECEECKEKKASLQRSAKGVHAQHSMPAIVNDVLQSPGERLRASTGQLFEPRFGQDFSGVRVHVGSKAAESAHAVNALAYTVGQDIVFGAGQYQPTSDAGLRLISHELAHTVQPAVLSGKAISDPGDASEREAEAAGNAALSHRPLTARVRAGSVMQRQAIPDVDLTQNASPFMAASLGSVTIDGFELGQSDISPDNRAKLETTAHYIAKLLVKYPLSTIRAIGHTDAVDTDEKNMVLGQERADAVRKALTEMGVLSDAITAESKGKSALLVKTEKPEPRNRRVEVKFEPKASPLGPILRPPEPLPKPGDGKKVETDFCKIKPGLCPEPDYDKPNLPPDYWKPIPPLKKKEQSVLDVINEKIVDPIVKTVTKGLPDKVREKILDLAHDGVEKGITSAAKAAAAAAGIDSNGQQAIEKAMEAAIKQKGGGSGSEQEGSSSK
jgi:outer membrane protein OmpA-like peptidoglycan-associated protein